MSLKAGSYYKSEFIFPNAPPFLSLKENTWEKRKKALWERLTIRITLSTWIRSLVGTSNMLRWLSHLHDLSFSCIISGHLISCISLSLSPFVGKYGCIGHLSYIMSMFFCNLMLSFPIWQCGTRWKPPAFVSKENGGIIKHIWTDIAQYYAEIIHIYGEEVKVVP